MNTDPDYRSMLVLMIGPTLQSPTEKIEVTGTEGDVAKTRWEISRTVPCLWNVRDNRMENVNTAGC